MRDLDSFNSLGTDSRPSLPSLTTSRWSVDGLPGRAMRLARIVAVSCVARARPLHTGLDDQNVLDMARRTSAMRALLSVSDQATGDSLLDHSSLTRSSSLRSARTRLTHGAVVHLARRRQAGVRARSASTQAHHYDLWIQLGDRGTAVARARSRRSRSANDEGPYQRSPARRCYSIIEPRLIRHECVYRAAQLTSQRRLSQRRSSS